MVLTSFQIKIWGKLDKGFLSCDCLTKITLIDTSYSYFDLYQGPPSSILPKMCQKAAEASIAFRYIIYYCFISLETTLLSFYIPAQTRF